ncbi:MAG: TonB-dependent receptor plug domain-containing protein, partial [Pseudomonadales bacterium]|nr:TonB-dependent receptor plug domain-containing protein [Pseudomonadales bacterium]
MSKFLPADRSSRRSRSWMLASAVLACSGGADVYAASGDFIQTEEVVVLGRRPIAESEMAALEAQRNYPSLVSIVSADTVGRFPDQNIAFAVGRLPGIGIQRDQGQARYVNLRGAPNNWTTISFDGINVVSPEGRTSRFDNIPSALAAQIEARKAVTADMPGETLAGNVNIVTRSPFDYDGFHVQANSGIGYVGLGGNEEVDTSLVLSNKLADDTFGVLVSGSYYHRNMVTDNTETDWEPVSADAGLPGAGDRPLWAREHENKLYRLTRRNFSWSGRLGWRPEANHDLFLSSIYTTFEDDELRSNIRWDLDDRQSGTPDTPCADRPNGGATVSGGASGYADVCTGNTPFVGTVYGVDFIDNFNDLESKESIFTNTLGGDHALSNGWEIAWRLNYTNTEDGVNAPALTDYNSPSDRLLRPTVAYDLSDPDRQRAEVFRTVLDADGNYTRGERVIAVENFQRDLVRLRRRWGGTKTDAYTARVTGLRQFDFGTPVDLKLGLEWSDRTKTDEERIFDIDDDGIIAAGLPRDFSAIALDEPYLGDLELGY